ncbi:Tsr4 protein [Saccharomycopsis crataegensis]|uniref:Tsr4 protein n=1 Tax=Saccharomycopsis crataegensis TaxID=43959 RepID=A0AAV5QN55_9ASCO|nr:Tsr4 protein [Saccharomycopsis crataegensis]
MAENFSDEESLFETSSNSKTFLGYVDVPISADEQPTLEDSFIGGNPLWLDGQLPPSKMLTCGNCGSGLGLLLQSYAPLPNSANDRVIYVFGCQNYKCTRQKGSIRCIKGVKFKKVELSVEEKMNMEKQKEYEVKLQGGLFGKDKNNDNPFGGSNPFAAGSSSTSANPFSGITFDKQEEPKKEETKEEKKDVKKPSFSQIASKSAPKQKTTVEKDVKLSEYPGYILYVEKERIGTDDDVLPPIPDNIQFEEADVADSVMKASSTKTEEFKSEILDDSEFQAFSKRVAHNPNQVLRYELGGEPLIYSSKNKTKIENGAPAPVWNSQSERQFELQLMPKAIIDLEVGRDVMEGMEWGTISVFTDVEDFVPSQNMVSKDIGYVEEWPVVEWEEQLDYSKIKVK